MCEYGIFGDRIVLYKLGVDLLFFVGVLYWSLFFVLFYVNYVIWYLYLDIFVYLLFYLYGNNLII